VSPLFEQFVAEGDARIEVVGLDGDLEETVR
jgi:hypothetical protein